MKMKRTAAAAAFVLLSSCPAFAQSSPGLYQGQVPSAAQWNSYFAAKQDFVANFGTAAYYNVGTSGANVPALNGANTWSAAQTFNAVTVTTLNNLPVGTAASQNTGTSGATVPLLNANNHWSGTNTFDSFSITSLSVTALTATTINGNTITAGSGVLTISAAKSLVATKTLTLAGTDGKTFSVFGNVGVDGADSKVLTISNSLTLSGTDGSVLNVGGGGTLGSAAFKNTGTSGNVVPLLDGSNTFSGTITTNGGLNINGGFTVGASTSATISNGDVIVPNGTVYSKFFAVGGGTSPITKLSSDANGDLNISSWDGASFGTLYMGPHDSSHVAIFNDSNSLAFVHGDLSLADAKALKYWANGHVGVTGAGVSCAITEITGGVITGATC
jgi:hypothetical protein